MNKILVNLFYKSSLYVFNYANSLRKKIINKKLESLNNEIF
jgi:hypothetical protein